MISLQSVSVLYFQISSESLLRSDAEHKCRRLGGRLATLDDADQFDFVASIVVRRYRSSVTNGGLWTSATNFGGHTANYLQWANDSKRFTIMTAPFHGEGCVDANFHLGIFASISCTVRSYVCEKITYSI